MGMSSCSSFIVGPEVFPEGASVCSTTVMKEPAGQLQACARFCGPTSIPLVFGTAAEGFDLKTIVDAFGSLVSFNSTLLDQCIAWGSSLYGLQAKAAALLAAFDNLDWARLVYVAEVREETRVLVEALTSDETQEQMWLATNEEKVARLLQIVNQHLSRNMSTASQTLRVAMTALQNSMQALQSRAENAGKIALFLEHCDRLFPGSSPADELLLDICAADQQLCLEQSGAEHVACGCGVHPLAMMGTEFDLRRSIPGSTGRRLQEAFHVCAESNQQAQVAVNISRSRLQQLDPSLVSDREAAVKDRHSSYFCSGRRLADRGAPAAEPEKRSSALMLPVADQAESKEARGLAMGCSAFELENAGGVVPSALMGSSTGNL